MGKRTRQNRHIIRAQSKQSKRHFKITVTITIIIAVLGLAAGALYYFDLPQKWIGRKPDTYIFIFGLDSYLSLEKVKAKAPSPTKVTIHPVRLPKEKKTVTDVPVPTIFGQWGNKPGKKEYIILAQNRGNSIDRNVKVSIKNQIYSLSTSSPPVIDSVSIDNENRVNLIEGGIGSSFISMNIGELAPDEKQEVKFLANFMTIDSVSVYSEIQGDINNIYIYDIKYNTK